MASEEENAPMSLEGNVSEITQLVVTGDRNGMATVDGSQLNSANIYQGITMTMSAELLKSSDQIKEMILIVNDDNSLSLAKETLDAIKGSGDPMRGPSIYKRIPGDEGLEEKLGDVESSLFFTKPTEEVGTPQKENADVDMNVVFLFNPEEMARLESALLSDEAKKMFGDDFAALMKVLLSTKNPGLTGTPPSTETSPTRIMQLKGSVEDSDGWEMTSPVTISVLPVEVTEEMLDVMLRHELLNKDHYVHFSDKSSSDSEQDIDPFKELETLSSRKNSMRKQGEKKPLDTDQLIASNAEEKSLVVAKSKQNGNQPVLSTCNSHLPDRLQESEKPMDLVNNFSHNFKRGSTVKPRELFPQQQAGVFGYYNSDIGASYSADPNVRDLGVMASNMTSESTSFELDDTTSEAEEMLRATWVEGLGSSMAGPSPKKVGGKIASSYTQAAVDDPYRLWCICRKPHNNRFMICCDMCDEWFHANCVNITKARGRQMEEDGKDWVCRDCRKQRKKNREAAISNKIVKKKREMNAEKRLASDTMSGDQMPGPTGPKIFKI